jgi:DNA polymerase IV
MYNLHRVFYFYTMKNSLRKIIHVDMDAFYASVEQRDFPEYQGKPLAVGGSKERGVVAAASYEARKFGVHSAMSSKIAIQRCPEIVFVRPRMDVYKAVSRQVMEILQSYTSLVEPLSLDEAYLDVTQNHFNIASATQIAKEIRRKIKTQTQLTASAGVSFNKFLAKIASDMNKPDGLTVIPPDKASLVVDGLKIEKIFGIGKVTAAKMKAMGIHSGADLKKMTETELTRLFGKPGLYYHRIVNLQDERLVVPDRPYKSVGAENTFEKDVSDIEVMLQELRPIAESVSRRLIRNNLAGKTITLKMKFYDFTLMTRSKTIAEFINSEEEIFSIIKELLHQHKKEKAVRLLGISVSNFLGETKEKENIPGQLNFDF